MIISSQGMIVLEEGEYRKRFGPLLPSTSVIVGGVELAEPSCGLDIEEVLLEEALDFTSIVSLDTVVMDDSVHILCSEDAGFWHLG